jgi:hypothetical protein
MFNCWFNLGYLNQEGWDEWEFSMQREWKVHKNVSGEPQVKKQCRQDSDTDLDIREIGCESVDWIQLDLDRPLQAFVNILLSFWVHKSNEFLDKLPEIFFEFLFIIILCIKDVIRHSYNVIIQSCPVSINIKLGYNHHHCSNFRSSWYVTGV